MKRKQHELAGKTVKLNVKGKGLRDIRSGAKFAIEDWVENVLGDWWTRKMMNPCCVMHGLRVKADGVSPDDDVLYGKINGLGYIVHNSELGEEVNENA